MIPLTVGCDWIVEVFLEAFEYPSSKQCPTKNKQAEAF
jgi:hypothetical protein